MSYIGKLPAVTALTASDVADGIITNAKLAQDIISGDTALGAEPASTDELLLSDAGTLKRIDYTLITNAPAFEAHLSGNQSISDNTATKVQCNTELFDTGGMYDNSTNYRFTPTVAGKYFVYGTICSFGGDAANELNMSRVFIYKNGSLYKDSYSDYSGSPIYSKADFNGAVIDMNGSSDYVELYGQVDGISAGSEAFLASDKNTAFGAYKLTGV